MRLFPWYVIRTNPIAYDSMDQFSDEKLAKRVYEYLLRCRLFTEECERKADELGLIFGRTKNNKILNYKRRIYNQRKVNLDKAPAEIQEITALYEREYKELHQLKESLEKAYFEIEEEEREDLWRLFKTREEIANPLPLVSHKMYYRLKKYLEKPSKEHRAKVRKLDSTLLRILARSTYKTSPFSSFTSFELKKFNSKSTPNELEKTYIQELNFYVLQKIIQLISQDEEFLTSFSYRFSGVSYTKKEMEFIIRYDINRGKIFNNIEQQFTLANNPIFQELSSYKDPLSYQEVIQILSGFMEEEKAVHLFKEVFLKKGIMYPDLEIDEYSEDILKEFYGLIEGLDHKSHKKSVLLDAIQNIEGFFQQYKKASYKDRFKIYHQITKEMDKIGQLFDHSFFKENIFYEDHVIRNSEEQLKLDSSFLDNLAYIQKLAVLTSVPLQFKYEFAHKYKKLYGDKLQAVRSKEIRDLYLEEVMKFTTWANVLAKVERLQSKGGKLLEEIKGEIREYLFELKHRGGPAKIDRKKIDEWYSRLQRTMNLDVTPLSSTVLFQKSADNYVLNKLYAGNLKLFIRYFQFEEGLYEDEDFKQYVKSSFPEDMLEIREGFGFNANYHQRFIKQRLMIPFSKSYEKDKFVKRSKDLVYQYNEETETVDIIEESKQEKPLDIDYIGSLVDYMLPPSIRMLTTMMSPRLDARYFDLWEFEEDKEDLILDYLPRLDIGNITMMRERWLISVKHLIKGHYTSDYEFYSAMVNRFKENELPLEFFASKYIAEDDFDFESANRSEMKPIYLNLGSPLFVKEFRKLFQDEQYIVIEEFYPKKSHESYNTEYQIEVNLR